MNLAAPLLFLPLLHKDIAHLPGELFAGSRVAQSLLCLPALSLWPGLPLVGQDSSSIWQPDFYPFTPQEAAACLRDIGHMGEMALSGVPVEAFATVTSARESARESVQDLAEQQELQNFVVYASSVSSTGSVGVSSHEAFVSPHDTVHEHVLRAAQKFLLMAWYVEERFLEVRALTRDYDAGTISLHQALGVEFDDGFEAEEHDTTLRHLAQFESHLQDIRMPLPNWQKVLENAALFLPQHCNVLINDKRMVDHVREHCILQHVDVGMLAESLGISTESMTQFTSQGTFLSCTLCVGDVVGKPALASSPWLQKTLHCIFMENV